ncbi:hypothetical protein NPX79_03690 [Spiroplasma endosymbiont of Anurida maritima]|uniref:hypothetical protein n=1 Tax=Spiroplasma endosymbiont of Anurida maritima TaxID=2967972 RepID=UPI0036D3E94F
MSFFNKIFRSKNKKNNNVEEVSIKPIEGEKEDLSSISPVDNDVNNTKTTNTEKSTEPETSVKNNELSKILSNAKTALKQEQVNVNSNDDIMKRLENIKKNSETITDYSEYKSDFQKMLDRVKKR